VVAAKNIFSAIFILLHFTAVAQTALTCGAGSDLFLCPNVSGQLNGFATGGKSPYTFHWEPAGFCTDADSAGTSVNVTSTTTFTLTVVDANQDTCTDIAVVYVDDIRLFGAGPDKWLCLIGGAPVTIGDPDNYQGNYTFSWQPTSNLSNPASPNPTATPDTTTTFTLTITSPSCGVYTDSVIVTVYQIDPDAGPTVTIDEGETVTLQGSGGDTYYWSPNISIKYENTANPDVNPTSTITYLMAAFNSYGCPGYDTVSVIVRPYSGLFFYNTFTPNGDGNNDTWVIGNIHKYPDNVLEIYNRYGQLVFKKHGYANDWSGSYLGEELPSGTYFYYLDTKTDTGKFKGSLTIMR
jgi:gliding motility-associated-like protein